MLVRRRKKDVSKSAIHKHIRTHKKKHAENTAGGGEEVEEDFNRLSISRCYEVKDNAPSREKDKTLRLLGIYAVSTTRGWAALEDREEGQGGGRHLPVHQRSKKRGGFS